MGKYIDTDKWWAEAQKLYTNGDCGDEDRYKVGINVGITKSKCVMSHIQGIDIVRCKECKHREEYPCKVYHDDDWYCADGEREGE